MKDFSKKSVEQIIRVDGKDAFVEIMNSSFEIGKVKLGFNSYDTTKAEGSRIKANVDIYMDIPDFLTLLHSVETGCLHKKIEAERAKAEEERKKGNKYYEQAVYTKQGGTSAASLAKKGKSRADGMSEARILNILPGQRTYAVLEAQKGPGIEDDNGLIIPRFKDHKPEARIFIPIKDIGELYGILKMAEVHYQAFLSSKYAAGEMKFKPDRTA